MSIKLDIKPDSKEHFEIRKDFWCASEAPAVMNVSPFSPHNRVQLALVKQGVLIPQIYEKAVAHGRKYEGHARLNAEIKTGRNFWPEVWCKDRFLASPDGVSDDKEIYLEIKCPYSPKSQIIKSVEEGEIPEHYKWQLDHGLYVTGCKKALFAVLYPDGHTMKYIYYQEDVERQGRLIDAWHEFDALMKKPIVQLKNLSNNTLDGIKLQKVQDLITARQNKDEATDIYKSVLADTIKLLKDEPFTHPVVSFVPAYKRKGAIDYKAAFEGLYKLIPQSLLEDDGFKFFDLEDYRGKETQIKDNLKFKKES